MGARADRADPQTPPPNEDRPQCFSMDLSEPEFTKGEPRETGARCDVLSALKGSLTDCKMEPPHYPWGKS